MLQTLRIRDFVLVEDAELAFGPGLNLITGETGTGKSLIVDALEVLGGARASADSVRAGQNAAILSVTFSLDDDPAIVELLTEAGIPALSEDGDDGRQVIVRRVIRSEGASKCFVNDTPVTVALLRAVMERVLLVQGQHAQVDLFQPARHRDLLDEAAATGDLVAAIGALHAQAASLLGQIREITQRARERVQRMDFLRFQLAEIDAAKLRAGEHEELATEERKLAHAEELLRGARQLVSLLQEDEAAVMDRLGQAESLIGKLTAFDPQLARAAELLGAAHAQVEEAALELSSYAETVDYDPRRLAAVVERLELLRKLSRKYGATADDILQYRRDSAAELEKLAAMEERGENLAQELASVAARGLEVAGELSRRRREAAPRLAADVLAELRQLGMPDASFVVAVEPGVHDAPPFGPHGCDTVTFLFAANPGEPPQRLGKVASGGELSRVLLALRVALAKTRAGAAAAGGTLLFDEVDAGIGGRTASAVAVKLAELASGRQVLVITHQPQVASLPGAHFHVVKETLAGAARTRVLLLDSAARIAELARMLGGENVTDVALLHARELLGNDTP
ncbi:MAG: DNA repair protein RecN [Candidatus Schekmanbacteria bacterium]|nr:DNA repair protein RecN [Candidatus Schekmanbacteria bacterium]